MDYRPDGSHEVPSFRREVGRLTDWEGPVFAGRYRAILVSPEESAQVRDAVRPSQQYGAGTDIPGRGP
jgi:hypothetical protein